MSKISNFWHMLARKSKLSKSSFGVSKSSVISTLSNYSSTPQLVEGGEASRNCKFSTRSNNNDGLPQTDNNKSDKRIHAIHKSTKTLLPFFAKHHNYLRMKSRHYYAWHLQPYAIATHYLSLIHISEPTRQAESRMPSSA